MADTGAMDWLCMEEVMAKTNSSGREGGKRELLKLLEEERRRGKRKKEEEKRKPDKGRNSITGRQWWGAPET